MEERIERLYQKNILLFGLKNETQHPSILASPYLLI